MKRRKPFWRRLSAAAAFLWMVSLLPAEAPPTGGIPSASWDAAVPPAFPSWFGPVQSFASAQTTVWRASLRPPPGSSRLAATFVFEETEHGVARLIWQGAGRSQVLCSNLFEGAAPLHQRTILLGREILGGAGQLVVESAGLKPVVVRAEFSWVEPLVLAATGWTPPGLFLAPSGKIFPSDELTGQTGLPPADESRQQVVDAVLDPGPVRCPPNTPVRFLSSIPLEPSFGRVQARVAGLRPGEEPEIWVNGSRLPSVTMEIPGLDDPGYRWAGGKPAAPEYGGWRTAVAWVPPGWLRRGENQVDWISPAGTVGMTLRHVRLQLSYEAPTAMGPVVSPSAPVPAAKPPPAVWPVSAPKLRLGLSSPDRGVGLRSE